MKSVEVGQGLSGVVIDTAAIDHRQGVGKLGLLHHAGVAAPQHHQVYVKAASMFMMLSI